MMHSSIWYNDVVKMKINAEKRSEGRAEAQKNAVVHVTSTCGQRDQSHA
jgi:hypothetical protein